MLYQLFNRSNLSSSLHVRKPPKQVGKVFGLATYRRVVGVKADSGTCPSGPDKQTPGRVQLCAVVVEAGGRIADLEAQGFQLKGIVTH